MLFGAPALARASQDEADARSTCCCATAEPHRHAARYGDSELRIGRGWRATARTSSSPPRRARARQGGARRPSTARSSGARRSRRSHPAPFARSSRRLDVAMGPDGALEACVRASRKGSRASSRDRPRLDDRGHAPPQPRALRLRRGAAAYNFFMAQDARYREAFEAVLASAASATWPCR